MLETHDRMRCTNRRRKNFSLASWYSSTWNSNIKVKIIKWINPCFIQIDVETTYLFSIFVIYLFFHFLLHFCFYISSAIFLVTWFRLGAWTRSMLSQKSKRISDDGYWFSISKKKNIMLKRWKMQRNAKWLCILTTTLVRQQARMCKREKTY